MFARDPLLEGDRDLWRNEKPLVVVSFDVRMPISNPVWKVGGRFRASSSIDRLGVYKFGGCVRVCVLHTVRNV